MNRALNLVYNSLRAASQEQGHGSGMFAALDKDPFVLFDLSFFYNVGAAEVFLKEIVKVGNYSSSSCLCKFGEITFFYSPYGNNSCLGKIVLGHVIDALLTQDHVCSRANYLVDHCFEHSVFFIQE